MDRRPFNPDVMGGISKISCALLVTISAGVLTSREVRGQAGGRIFTLLKPEKTNLRFTNKVREDDSLHVLLYEYLYNGHGIGVGDFNGDGFDDVFISGNSTDNKLFLNKGNMQFEDVTRSAGVRGNGTWSTGVSIADVNNDGLPDIYVCHSGKHSADDLKNELFINTGLINGKPVFREEGAKYGLDAPGTQSTQAAFIDYDRDGDLDMFLLNHSMNTYSAFLNTRQRRATPDLRYGNRLFRNDVSVSGTYTDVTLKSGIINNALNYGLSVNVADINQDGWPDIYTTSDYTEHDCLYINNQNGTFTQSLDKSFHHVSKFSMGADIADFNNDALPDVLTLDMLPEDNHRQKLLKGPDEYDQYHLLLDSGYYRQHMRNMLQLNRGADADGNVRFSEIGQLAGVSNTDWSWAGLFADFDSDGWKDILITNGYLRDFTDLDFLKYTMPDAQLREAAKGNLTFRTYDLVQKMPSNKLRNYLFRNTGNLQFENVSEQWGFRTPSVSNAAVYSDFDNDGDLDLLIGNNNEPVQLWRNDNREGKLWLQVRLQGNSGNRFALGAKVWIYQHDLVQYQELYPVRGFQSSVTYGLYFGLGSSPVDSLVVAWPSGMRTVLKNVQPNRILNVSESDKSDSASIPNSVKRETIFDPRGNLDLPFRHKENDFVDFKVEVLMPYQLSRMGPALAAGDVNGDGLDDVYLGGAIGQAGQLLIQTSEGTFTRSPSSPWTNDAHSEDVNATFLDADNDGDPDLYVVSGGNEYEDGAPEFQDRLYLNEGNGVFSKATRALPAMLSNKHALATGDFDGDGDLDIFVGGRGKPGYFPEGSASYLLRNDSDGNTLRFTDVTNSVVPGLRHVGMVTVAAWSDLTGDRFPELILAGDWMPVFIYRNDHGKLTDVSKESGTSQLFGQWSALTVADLDKDGLKDLLFGNCGLNHQFKPTASEPMTIHVSDFDGNGNLDPILSYYIGGRSFPSASRDELLDQIPSLKKRYVKYADYADQDIESIFNPNQLSNARILKCTEGRSLILHQDQNLSFSVRELPLEAQFSATHSILAEDLNADDHIDLLLLGNFFPYRTQMGEADGSYGLVLLGNGKTFQALTPEESGLWADGDARTGMLIRTKDGKGLVVARNDAGPLFIKFMKK